MKNKLLLFILLIPIICLFGHYIRYTIDWNKTDLQQFEDKNFTKDDFIDSLNKTSYRFYVSETHAKYLDKLLMESWDAKEEDKKIVEVVYSYKNGKHPIAKKLLVNGQPYQKII